jgi:hypothetical protein
MNNVDIPPEFYQFNYIDEIVRFTIKYLAKKSESGEIIILIDEYDSPITRALGDELKGEANIELAKKNRDFLRSFFTPFKPLTNLIHLLFITGVSKFSYTNLFSSMNDLTDISSMIEFHSMIGYTLEEVKQTYTEEYSELQKMYGNELDERIIKEYNGYRFNTKAKEGILNPWDINNLLFRKEFESYWALRGRSKYLWTLFDPVEHNIGELLKPNDKYQVVSRPIDLDELINPRTETLQKLLCETGYLTIRDNQLTIPNESVKRLLLEDLSERLNFKLTDDPIIVKEMREALVNEDMKKLFECIGKVINTLPYTAFKNIVGPKHPGKIECVYTAALFVSLLHLKKYIPELFYLNELATSTGSIDIFVRLKRSCHIIEFKVVKDQERKGVNSFLKEALQQMKDRDYANNQVVLQHGSNLDLYLNAFIYDFEGKVGGVCQSIPADQIDELLAELEQKSEKRKKNGAQTEITRND